MDYRILCVALIALVPTAAATIDSILPPTWSDASYDPASNTINITWDAPQGDLATPYVYHVYRDGGLVNTTTARQHVENVTWARAVYQVVASHAGNESLPSSPLVAQSDPGEIGVGMGNFIDDEGPVEAEGWPCPILGTRLLLDTPPFLFFVVYEQCVPLIGNILADPIDGIVETGWG